MRSDVIRQLTVAVAVSVSQDSAAYEMLQIDYIGEFMRYYKEKLYMAYKENQPRPSTLDVMINFAIKELPIRYPECQSLSDLLTDVKKAEIKHRFIAESVEHMLTSLAKRDTIRDCIRQFLHVKDKRNTHSKIDTTKIESIMTGFMIMFEESYAASFQFTGTFLDYVMHCFSHFYYPSRKKDIWQSLNAVDFAKREAETNMTSVTMLLPQHSDDLLIHELLINISEVNTLLFNHSGQSEDARGVHYDIFYMIMLHQCQKKIDALNSKLEEADAPFRIQLIDERDRKEARNGIAENKGIANKIGNARMLIPVLFDMVSRSEWTLDNLTEVRDICFSLGKKDRDGKNCVWKDVQPKAETSRYFDVRTTAHNLKAFEQIFKGVLSVHALMSAYEERGLYIVDMYRRCPTLFEDKRLPRSIDRLSALDHIDLILQLMEEGDNSVSHTSGELLKFEDMVHEYAGSEQNNGVTVRSNRTIAFSRGLLDPKARMKQAGNFQSFYEQLRSAAGYMTAIPRSFEEYVWVLLEEKRLPAHYGPEAVLSPPDVVEGKYSSLYHNKFMTDNPEVAEYYLYRVAKKEVELQSFEWHIGNSMFCSVMFSKLAMDDNGTQFIADYYYLYNPLVDAFLCIPTDALDDGSNPKLLVRTLDQIQMDLNDSYYNGQYTAQITRIYQELPRNVFSTYIHVKVDKNLERDAALDKSLGFGSFLGFENYGTADVIRRLEKIEVYPRYKSSVERYSSWMSELSKMQFSFIELAQTMLAHGIFVSRCSLSTVKGVDIAEGQQLVESLLRTEFTEQNLAWFFSHLEEAMSSGHPLLKVNMRWGTVENALVEFENLYLSILDIIYNRNGDRYKKGTLMYECYRVLRDYDTAPQRFVQIYNFITTKLNFLRVLRDAYDLVFDVVATELTTFGCEINSRFNIESTMTSSKDNVGSGGMLDSKYAIIDTIPISEVMRLVGQLRQTNWMSFSVLCDDLLKYFKHCRQDISDLVDYDVGASNVMQSKFKDWGSAFFAIPVYTNPIVIDCLKEIKAKSRVDDSGFILSHNSYFKGYFGDSEYYVHVSGRMVEVNSNYMGPATFNFDLEEDCKRYEAIIRSGRGNHVW